MSSNERWDSLAVHIRVLYPRNGIIVKFETPSSPNLPVGLLIDMRNVALAYEAKPNNSLVIV